MIDDSAAFPRGCMHWPYHPLVGASRVLSHRLRARVILAIGKRTSCHELIESGCQLHRHFIAFVSPPHPPALSPNVHIHPRATFFHDTSVNRVCEKFLVFSGPLARVAMWVACKRPVCGIT